MTTANEIQLLTQVKASIPNVDEIRRSARQEVSLDAELIRADFGRALIKWDEDATRLFLQYEKETIKQLASGWLSEQGDQVKQEFLSIASEDNWDEFVKRASAKFADFGVLAQKLEKDLGNMRKARGGSTFQKNVADLLRSLGIPVEVPGQKDALALDRMDLVVPSTSVAMKTPDKAFFITCKRTLRERWKQEVSGGKANRTYYLITIDHNIAPSKALEIKAMGMIAFVPSDAKDKEGIREVDCIRPLSEFPGSIGLNRWK